MPEALASLGPISGARIGLNAKGKAGFTHFRFYVVFPLLGGIVDTYDIQGL